MSTPGSGAWGEMMAMGVESRLAARMVRQASADIRNGALRKLARRLRDDAVMILSANIDDLAIAERNGAGPAMLDRLRLDAERIEAMARGIEEIAELPNPVGRVLAHWQRPNGLDISRVATPIGVIGIVYESRPNVTADAAALCLKSGNACILRGGSEAIRTNGAIHDAIFAVLAQSELPTSAVELVRNTDREIVGQMLSGLGGALDLIIPRGGKSLVARVQQEARVPVLAHLEGNCHVYVHAAADPGKARAIVLNAKMRRTGVCGAAETLLMDRAVLPTLGAAILGDLAKAGCEIRADEDVLAIFPDAKTAAEEDWRTEYLDAIIAVKAVDGVEDAIRHIDTHGSHHTESIVTEDAVAAERFLAALDSAIVMWNASTQFADGGEFGMGAEIGIGTGKLHARGPVGVEQLTTFKYVVRGAGQVRP
jgi:glutamate-5-semialdehyde dehydrogenase